MEREETLVDFTCYFNSAIPRRLPGLLSSLPFCALKHFTSLFLLLLDHFRLFIFRPLSRSLSRVVFTYERSQVLLFDLQLRVRREACPSARLEMGSIEADMHMDCCLCGGCVLPELGGWQFIAIYHPVGSNAAVCDQTATTVRLFLKHVT